MLMLAPILLLSQAAAPPPSPVTLPGASRFHLVRSTSGSRGAPDRDRFLIEDPRTLFHQGIDRQVLVLFEWQGPLGPHHCEGVWRDPSGRAVLTSQSDLVSRGPRFGVYWGLSLSNGVTAGTWVVEARIDGEPAGVHAFQVTSSAPDGSAAPVRRALPMSDLYRRGLALTPTIEALNASGEVQMRTSGALVGPGLVRVTFSSINAARTVRAVMPDSSRLETSEVVSWNRRENWAILRFAGFAGKPADRAPEVPAVGDRLFFLEASADGTRTILTTSVIGRSARGELVLDYPASDSAEGAGLFNEYGELAATMLGSKLLGAKISAGAARRAWPLGSTPEAGASRTLQQLEEAGEFVRPVVPTKHFVSVVLGTGVEHEQGIPVAVGQGSQFSRNDQQCVVFATLVPHLKQDVAFHMELYDASNERLFASDPKNVNLREGQTRVLTWTLPLSSLAPGFYRADVFLGADPVFRSFFRVTD